MVRNGEISVADVKRILRRFWWIPLVSMLVLGSIGFGATRVLTKKYTSTTSVLVEMPAVSADYVPPVMNDDFNQRLASMKSQVLSSSRLQPVIEKFNLFADERSTVSMEELEGRLRKAVDVTLLTPMQGASVRQPPGFQVAVTFEDPQIAQKICAEMTSMFMKQNVEIKLGVAKDTTQFLGDQVDQAKAKLDEQDAKLAQFKQKNLGVLPEEVDRNLSMIATLNTQLETNNQAIARAQQDKSITESLLAQAEQNWSLAQTGQVNPETQEQQLASLQEQYNALLLRYTPEHPDVVKLRAQLEDLKRRIAEDPGTKGAMTPTQAKMHEPPQLLQYRNKIKQDDFSVADLTKRQGQIQQQIGVLQSRVQMSPMIEEQLKELMRSYQTAQEFYNDLLKKRANSSMATELETQQQSGNFRVLDPPSLPTEPSFPKLPIFLGGGVAAGLALALGLLYLLAAMDHAMYNERDVEIALKLPVLTMVPSLDPFGAKSAKNRNAGKFESAVLKA
jgi:polysaccharide chain length determinant protein (PEP-CTERM system associated)